MISFRPKRLGSVPWWGRLEFRVIAALTVLGTLCVGSSAYLVQLTVAYFELRLERSLAQAVSVAQSVAPLHQGIVDAHVDAFEARGRALAYELALLDRDDSSSIGASDLQTLIERDVDIVSMAVHRPGIEVVQVQRGGHAPGDDDGAFEVSAPIPSGEPPSELRIAFFIDPEIDRRYQDLGQLQREIGLEHLSLRELEIAVLRVVTVASIGVLVLSILLGMALARAMTRKASELSRVMRRVGRGEIDARARSLGGDELGQLATAFNTMLDELKRAQDKVAYLQRIGAWQEMARRLAHEIKNPLTPIQLAAQQLREKDPGLSPEFSRMLATSVEIIEDEVAGLRRMVASFSQFAKVPQVRLDPVDVDRILDEFERAYGHLTEHADDVLAVARLGHSVLIPGDRLLLKQVLVNLVENAVLSAREAGRAPVVVHVGVALEGEHVVWCVDDNGPGIEPTRYHRVFEPYETTRPDGTGLGLAIVKKIVLDHGGEVSIEKAPLGGARFKIRLLRSL